MKSLTEKKKEEEEEEEKKKKKKEKTTPLTTGSTRPSNQLQNSESRMGSASCRLYWLCATTTLLELRRMPSCILPQP